MLFRFCLTLSGPCVVLSLSTQKEQALPGFSLIGCMAKATVLPVSIVTKSLRPRLFRRTRLIIHKPVTYEEYSSISEKPTKPEISYYLFDKVCEPFKKEGE